jgi:hypothetical protein
MNPLFPALFVTPVTLVTPVASLRMRAVHSLLAATVTATAMVGGGCSKLVGVEIAVVEPCGQETRALNGVQSFRVVTSGAAPDSVVAFTVDQPAGVAIGLGEKVIVSVEGYTDDITATETPEQPSVLPRSVGRTMPLSITEGSLDVKATVMVGSVDSFGSPRDDAGDCTEMDSGDPTPGRHAHTASFIPGANKVLIFGGAVWAGGTESILKSAEVYDVASGTFTALPTPAQARAYHTATVLPDGRVVILGGFSLVNSQVAPIINGLIVDVRADQPYVGDIILRTPRTHHTATLLADVGMIAIIGGCTGSAAQGCTPTSATAGSTNLVPSVEILNISNLAQSVPAQGGLVIPRAMHQAVGFPSGNTGVIVVSGGLNDSGALRSIEFLQVANGNLQNVFAQADALPEAVVRHQMIAFNDSQFVITGGQATATNGILSDAIPGTNSVTICDKTDGRATCTGGAPMVGARFGHAAARLIDGTVIVIGGAVAAGGPTSEALRFAPGGGAPAWGPTQGPLPLARERAALTLLGGDLGNGFVNQLFYSGGHTTLQPYTSHSGVDIYFGK